MLHVPTSSNNREQHGEHHMHPTQTGNLFYLGMLAHVRGDSRSIAPKSSRSANRCSGAWRGEVCCIGDRLHPAATVATLSRTARAGGSPEDNEAEHLHPPIRTSNTSNTRA